MKIVCVQNFPMDYCIDYVGAIASLGEVTLLAADRDLEGRVDYLDPRVEVVPLAFPRQRSLANLRLLYQLAREIRARDPDVVHLLGDGAVWLSLLPKLIGRRAIVITVHDAYAHPGDALSELAPPSIVDHLHRQATRLIVHGESIRGLLAQRARRDSATIDIVPHVALGRYQEVARRARITRPPDDTGKRLLFFGRIMTYKGLPHLLDAVELLRGRLPDLELVVAGNGPAYGEVADRLSAPELRVHRGHVADEMVAEFFTTTDLVVLPYVEASQSGILALAAAFGRPVLVTDVGELGEVVRATGMGSIVPPADPERLAEAILRFFAEPGEAAAQARRSGQAASSGLLSPKHVARCAGAAYKAAIGAHRHPAASPSCAPDTPILGG